MNIVGRIINFVLNWANYLFLERLKKFLCFRRNIRRGYRVFKHGKDNKVECLSWCPGLTVLMNGNHNLLHIDRRCTINRHCTVQIEGSGLEVRINEDVILSQCVHIVCQEQNSRIIIKEGTGISHHTMIRSSDSHSIIDLATGARANPQKDIIIGEHVWVAPFSTILKGVTVGRDAVIATGSVVTKDVPASCIAAGNPARIVKENIIWDLNPSFELLEDRTPYLGLVDEER